MNKYSYKGKVITASTREEAIKVFAVSIKHGWYPLIRKEYSSFNKTVKTELKNKFKNRIEFNKYGWVMCCDIKTRDEVFKYLINNGFKKDDLEKDDDLLIKGIPVEDVKKFIKFLGLSVSGNKKGYSITLDISSKVPLTTKEKYEILYEYIDDDTLLYIPGVWDDSDGIFENEVTKEYEVAGIQNSKKYFKLAKPFFDNTDINWKKIILESIVYELGRLVKNFDRSIDDENDNLKKVWEKCRSFYKKSLERLKSKLAKF